MKSQTATPITTTLTRHFERMLENSKEHIMNRKAFTTLTVSIFTLVALFALFAAPVSADTGMPGQINDRGELAEYQASLAAGPTPEMCCRVWIELPGNPGAPEQIVNLGELAAYQSHMADSFVPSENPTVNIVVQRGFEPFEQVADRGQLAQYQAHLLSGSLPAAGSMVAVERFADVANVRPLML
jgi:hypothetical protein